MAGIGHVRSTRLTAHTPTSGTVYCAEWSLVAQVTNVLTTVATMAALALLLVPTERDLMSVAP
jgi:hypothetical protein